MKKFVYNILVWMGRLYVAGMFLFIAILIIPFWILLEFINYMEQVTKARSQRAFTEYID